VNDTLLTAAKEISTADAKSDPTRYANAIRALAMDAVEKAKSGHPGMPMGMADVATVLFQRFMKFDAARPDWQDRDRFVLSAGHGSMLLYALLYLLGYPGMGRKELENFRQLGSPTAGHPEYGHAAGIETTTGPLGQGLATAVGMAIACATASGSWPSTWATCQPAAAKRAIWSVEVARLVGPSMEIELSSQKRMSFESFRCPARSIASWLTPSIRQPSPAIT
jgi:hypothetical protein